jgi:hypothetical protein
MPGTEREPLAPGIHVFRAAKTLMRGPSANEATPFFEQLAVNEIV